MKGNEKTGKKQEKAAADKGHRDSKKGGGADSTKAKKPTMEERRSKLPKALLDDKTFMDLFEKYKGFIDPKCTQCGEKGHTKKHCTNDTKEGDASLDAYRADVNKYYSLLHAKDRK